MTKYEKNLIQKALQSYLRRFLLHPNARKTAKELVKRFEDRPRKGGKTDLKARIKR